MDSTVHYPPHGATTTAGAISKRGARRQNNQDAFLIDEYLSMFVVADGVAQSAGGEIASAIACGQILDVLEATLPKVDAAGPADRRTLIENAIRNCFRAADRRIQCERSMEPFLSKMETTALLGFVDRDFDATGDDRARLYVGNAGDSRALLVRYGRAVQLTNDHTIAAGLMREALISEAEAERHPGKNMLYMNLGGSLFDGPEIDSCDAVEGDRLVLMTDGITKTLDNEEVAEIVSAAPDAETAAVSLASRAIEFGATDDVTCVVVEIRT